MTFAGVTPTREELIDDHIRAAPPGQGELDPQTIQHLLSLTTELGLHYGSRALATFTRFADAAFRELQPLGPSAIGSLGGQTILVTGGSGCIGRMLLHTLLRLGPARLVSLSRRPASPPLAVPGVEYLSADIRSDLDLNRIFDSVRPSVVFHLAAQRDPELAERQVFETASTNVLGTKRILDVAVNHGVSRFVYASTGKGHRLYTSDVYAATKQAGEWLTFKAGRNSGTSTAIVRFTHVVDNSIIRRKVIDWTARGEPIQLHDSHVGFYLQSARECAQLMIAAAIEAGGSGTFVSAIRDLGDPADLLDFALGAGLATGEIAPLYIRGFQPGYESEPHPAVYDPRISGDFSPLLNGMEAVAAAPSRLNPEIDRAPYDALETEGQLSCLDALEVSCFGADEAALRAALKAVSWELLMGRLKTYPVEARQRALGMGSTAAGGLELSSDHRLTTRALAESLRIPADLEAATHF